MARNRWVAPNWNRICRFCGIKLLTGEEHGWCCNRGQSIAPRLPSYPPELEALARSGQLSHISRKLNNLFCFTAIGTTHGFEHFKSGQSSVAVNGRVYHRILDVSQPNHSMHWYLYDAESVREASGFTLTVPINFIRTTKRVLDSINPYVHHLRRFLEYAEDRSISIELSDPPVGQDFAAIVHANNSTRINPRHILIWHNSNTDPTFVPIFSQHYEPLQYPLLFPHGTAGWGLTDEEGRDGYPERTVDFTQREWYKSRLLLEPRFSNLGRLTSEYMCDMYSRVEEERLLIIRRGRQSQARLRDPDVNTREIDIRLPSSFIGSHQWVSDQAADSLALAREFGRPSLFITMTFNPEWPEMTSELLPNQSVHDRPILMARVFKCRFKRLLHLIKAKFGGFIYLIEVNEFQKRGFPHGHIVVKVLITFSGYTSASNIS
jgi:hypothetical protein